LRREIEIQQDGVLMTGNVVVKWWGGGRGRCSTAPSVSQCGSQRNSTSELL